jgi:phosphoserine aminotransferase
MKLYEKAIDDHAKFQPLISMPGCRSRTVMAVEGKPDEISNFKNSMKQKGIILGNGYGPWKENTFRIANFPAIRDSEFNKLLFELQNGS